MLRSTLGWLALVGMTLTATACGSSSHDEQDADVPKAGTGGGAAGHADAGKAGSGVSAGRGGAGSGGATTGGRGGSAGNAAGSGAGGAGAGGSAAGAGRGGAAAGETSGGRGGVSGTSGDAGAPGEGGQSGALQDLDDTVASACSAAADCCAAQGITPQLGDCESLYMMRQEAVPGIMLGHITIDPTALARCKAAYGPGPDQCNLNAVVAACQGVFIGHQGDGEACTGVYDCDRSAGAMSCLITDTSGEYNVGTCHEIPHAQLNQPCFGTCEAGDECSTSAQGIQTPEELSLCFEDEGLYCNHAETSSVCLPLVPPGQNCEGAYDACGSLAVCDTTCQPRTGRGEDCGNCLRQYQCIDGKCTDPVWANESTCEGYPPGP